MSFLLPRLSSMSWPLFSLKNVAAFSSLAVVTLLLLFQCQFCEADSSIDAQTSALLSWKRSLNASGALSSWTLSETSSNSTPCNWLGITCNSQGLVTDLKLESVQLLGSVPSQFAAISTLRSLVISDANLTGTIPKQIGNYSSLTVLDFSGNRLTGPIPSDIGRLKNLQTLILNSNLLEGSIPPEIGNCSRLVNLVLYDNELGGQIPSTLGRLSKLEILRAGSNADVEGPLPADLGNCSKLSMLGLAETRVSGSIPATFGRLKNLNTLALYTAMLSGPIPPELGDCTNLQNLYLYGNTLSGSIPKELGKLQKLERVFLWQNSLVGSVPLELGNCSSLTLIDLSINSLTGSLPESFGRLQNLVELQLSDNSLTGSIPPSLANCTLLTQIQVDTNQLSGTIPEEMGKMQSLNLLYAWQNRLEGEIPASLGNCTNLQGLDLSENNLTGAIPDELFRLRNLSKLLLLSNDLTGPLSPAIGDCVALARVRLGNNKLSDTVPASVSKLKNLYFLELANNRFSGPIPQEIGSCLDLQYLDLHMNLLSGPVPTSLGRLPSLQVLDLSMNKLTGSIPAASLKNINKIMLNGNSLSGFIPAQLGDCKTLQLLDLSNNRLIGSIPKEIGNMDSLSISLNLSWNYLSGTLPHSMSSLTKLTSLDLSHNSLSGSLIALGNLDNLVSLNVSYNNFSGPLPNTNFFRQLTPNMFEGNSGLCTTEDSCFSDLSSDSGKQQQRNSSNVKLTISLLFSLAALLLFLGLYLVLRAKKLRQEKGQHDEDMENGWPWQMTLYQKLSISVDDIVDNLVNSNVIGKGVSGVVYRVQIPNGDTIAVKKLWPSKKCSLQRDTFSAEVRTLGSIRHRNIVRLLGYCSNRCTKLLMYDYMPNGSLGELLHEKRGMLEWEIRYNILLGAAQGLAYLHHDCVPCIVHRDIKANNILLGPRYEPYIADFGLAKLVESSDFSRSCTSVAGSYGYIAPEYGYTMKITEKCDVYSYGVMLLEVLTGRQPIDPSFREGMHIVEWVKETLQTNRDAVEVLDPRLQGRPDTQIQEMLQALGTALLCVNSNPEERPTMKDVAALLKEIRHDSDDAGKPNNSNTHAHDLLKNPSNPSTPERCNSNSSSENANGSVLRSLVYSSCTST